MAKNRGAAVRFSESEYGGQFTELETVVPVGTAKVVALQDNYNRISYIITNTGTTNITLRRDAGIVSGVGVLLLGNGATIDSNAMEDGSSVGRGWYAISDLAGGSLFIEETVETVSVKEA